MKKLLLVLLLAVLCSGCVIQGKGSTIGYVTTIEDTSFILGWDTVWFRVETGTYSSMQSIPEPYQILTTNEALKEQLLDTCRKNQKIELIYQKHVFTTYSRSNGEAIAFRILE